MKIIKRILLLLCFLFACSASAKEQSKQTLCPLMVDDEIDLEEFVTFKGVKVFMCCGSCKETWAKNPEYFAVVCQKQAVRVRLAQLLP